MTLDVPEWVTVREAAAAARVHKMTVYRLVETGELPAQRFGRSIRIPLDAVVRWINGQPVHDTGSGMAATPPGEFAGDGDTLWLTCPACGTPITSVTAGDDLPGLNAAARAHTCETSGAR